MKPPKDALRVIKPKGPKYEGLGIEWIAMRYDYGALGSKPVRAKVSMKLKGSAELLCEGIDIMPDDTPEGIKILWRALGEWCLNEARVQAGQQKREIKVYGELAEKIREIQGMKMHKISGMTGA